MGVADERQQLLPVVCKTPSSKGVCYDSAWKPAPVTSLCSAARQLENGALRVGEPPRLVSREVMGLLAQYAGIGFVSGVLPALIYPLLQGYLNAEGTTVVSANVLVHLPWSYKVFFGILSDCFPVAGYRRRPYMMLGWALCCCMLFRMASFSDTTPYYGDPNMHSTNPDQWTEAQRKSINHSAPDAAGKFVIPMTLAAFGYLLAEVPADAVVVEYAQREPTTTRGRLQSCIHSVRMSFHALGAFVVAVAFNGVEYGGSYDFSLSFSQMMFIVGCLSAPLAPAAWCFVSEEEVQPPKFSVYISQFWRILQQRAVCQLAAYDFLSGVFNNFNPVAYSNIKLYWVHATPFNASIMAIVGTFVYTGTLGVMAQRGLNWNWRVAIAVTALFGIITDVFMTMLVTWDVVRNQWLWLGIPIIVYIPHAVQFIVDNYVIVELIELGSEGALFGLLSTTTHVATPFGRTAAKLINAQFHVRKDDILADTYITRRDVTITVLICYGMKLASLSFLPLLPTQKAATQELRRYGGVSRSMGLCMVGVLLLALAWSTAVNLLSMNPHTKCWAITGGCTKH
ncbi:unnamed protein product [Phytophthora fragariaefolia]|uniref:Unnamed protein product n=1 Tax=Phytophthora fragariaefolia TaxID=1490495 RepID=A0A9W7CZZ3_9STRA|nr:unnamed protein product [Phytophthora fragariaefolia]